MGGGAGRQAAPAAAPAAPQPPAAAADASAKGSGGRESKGIRKFAKTRKSVPIGCTFDARSEFIAAPSQPARALEKRAIDAPTLEFLSNALRNHFIFQSLQETDHQAVLDALGWVEVKAGEVIFSQGESGDSIYFIQSGSFLVSIDGKEIRRMESPSTFGELALLYHMARSATITCVDAGELWQMDSTSFRSCVDKLSSTQMLRAETFFKLDHNFSGLPSSDSKMLAKVCTMQNFADGDIILREGEVGNWMFVIINGKVEPTDARLVDVFPNSGGILGSLGLVYGRRQPTGARAKGAVTCLAVARSSLGKLTDRIEDVLRRCAFKDLLNALHRKAGENNFFRELDKDQQHMLVSTAEDAVFEAGEVILCPGDPAQMLLVIEGEVAIFQQLSHPLNHEGDVTFVAADEDVRGSAQRVLTDGFGYGLDPEMLTGEPMEQFAVAICRSRLHRITHSNAVIALGDTLPNITRHNSIKKVLSDIFLFKNLTAEQVDRVVKRLVSCHFSAGEVVVKQGDPAKHFFLIQGGTIIVKKDDLVLRTLGRWDFFGERGLLMQENRSATCQAMEETICLSLDADTFFDIVGMFRKELERRMHLQDLNITMADLKVKAVVGRGTFGIVRLVHRKAKEQTLYALKCIKKWHIVKQNQEKAIIMERDVMAQCYHPCIVQYIKSFQDKTNIYFLTEFLGGGDMFFALREIGALNKLRCQYFSGSIALGLEYLHGRGIMHRDLKPENVLLDFEGAAKLVDFGCCKQEIRTTTVIGTPEYMAPEVIAGKGYTCVIDWWSLGVMMHEFIVGPLPFGANTDDQMAIFRSIMNDPLVIPPYVKDPDAVHIVANMLMKDTDHRLGGGGLGAKEIKGHPYYDGFNWDALAGGFFEPPWKPDAEAIMKNWEPPDGELMDHVSKEKVTFPKCMEWSQTF